MKTSPTYGSFVETLSAYLVLLGLALCLQSGLKAAGDGKALPMVQKECCVAAAAQTHEHANDAWPRLAQLQGWLSNTSQFKGNSAFIQDEDFRFRFHLQAKGLMNGLSYVSYHPLSAERYILYRNIRI